MSDIGVRVPRRALFWCGFFMWIGGILLARKVGDRDGVASAATGMFASVAVLSVLVAAIVMIAPEEWYATKKALYAAMEDGTLEKAESEARQWAELVEEHARANGGELARSVSALDAPEGLSVKDPWGGYYLIGGARRVGDFEIKSAGPDRRFVTGDDIVYEARTGRIRER